MRNGNQEFPGDDRGVSTTMGYVLTLGITATLISGLLIAGGAFIDQQRETVARDELQIVGDQLAAALMDTDRLTSASDSGNVEVDVWLPNRVAGGSYLVNFTNEGTVAGLTTTTIESRSPEAGVAVSVTIRTTFEVVNTTIAGGPATITARDEDGDSELELVVES